MTRKSAIVTGGASGIGFAIARAFALDGYPVAIVDVSAENSKEAAKQLSAETGSNIIGVEADVADAQACDAAYKQVISEFNDVSVLVNNAGFMPPRKGWIEELPLDDFNQMLSVHLGGAVNWCRLVIPSMRDNQFGRIINMASVNAILAVPHRYAYVTAKKAILGLTEALALDCARAGITVNAIAPGYTLTDTLRARADRGLLNHDDIAQQTPVGRWAQPEEIARVARFLADPDSGYISGTTIAVDGGLSIRGDANEDLDRSPFIS